MGKDKKYKIEVLCDYPEWWRYNVHLMVAGFDGQSNRLTLDNLSDSVYEAQRAGELREIPANYDPARPISLETHPCEYVEIYLYVVTNTFPESRAIKDSPPFQITMKVGADGNLVEQKTFDVNQSGGLTVTAYRVKA